MISSKDKIIMKNRKEISKNQNGFHDNFVVRWKSILKQILNMKKYPSRFVELLEFIGLFIMK